VIWDKKQVMVDINGAKQPLRFLIGFDECPVNYNTLRQRFPPEKKFKKKQASKVKHSKKSFKLNGSKYSISTCHKGKGPFNLNHETKRGYTLIKIQKKEKFRRAALVG